MVFLLTEEHGVGEERGTKEEGGGGKKELNSQATTVRSFRSLLPFFLPSSPALRSCGKKNGESEGGKKGLSKKLFCSFSASRRGGEEGRKK